MTGPQQSRPGGGTSRPSPRPRHGRNDEDTGDGFPENSYQGEGYPDLRPAGPVERPAPWTRGGYPDPPLYGEHDGSDQGADPGTGTAQPTGYAAPTRYDGYGAPEQAGAAQQEPADGEAARYGSSASRGGLAIDGGPPYSPAGGAATGGAVSTLAGPERDTAGPESAIPAQRDPAEARTRPTTVAEAAAARGFVDRGPGDRTAAERGVPARGTGDRGRPDGGDGDGSGDPSRSGRGSAGPAEVRVAKDSRALTALRVITYVLVSLSCLVFLAGVVYAGISYYEFRAALDGTPFGDTGFTGPGG